MAPFRREDIPPSLLRWIPTESDLVFPEQGMTSSVACVEPDGVVLKRCCDPIYIGWLRREREVLVALARLELPVPRPLDDYETDGEVWLVMTRLPGTGCSDVLCKADRRDRLHLLHRVGAFVRRLHRCAVPPQLRGARPWIERTLTEARTNLPWCDGSSELLERLVAERPPPAPETLIHGDLNLENLLVEGGEVTGLVDWAAGSLGDPRSDVALALQPDEDLAFDDAEQAAFFAGYGATVDAQTRRWFEDLYEFF